MDVFAFEQEYRRLKRHGHVDGPFAGAMTQQLIRAGLATDASARFDLRAPVTRIIEDLVSANPAEVWDEVTSAIERAAGRDAQRIRDAFDPEGDDRALAGPLFGVPRERILAWVRELPSERASFVASWLPLVQGAEGLRQWHPDLLSFIEEFAHIDGVLGAVTTRLSRVAGWDLWFPISSPGCHCWKSCQFTTNFPFVSGQFGLPSGCMIGLRRRTTRHAEQSLGIH
jgi:hypothetical protein